MWDKLASKDEIVVRTIREFSDRIILEDDCSKNNQDDLWLHQAQQKWRDNISYFL